jgi:hypothetical protein
VKEVRGGSRKGEGQIAPEQVSLAQHLNYTIGQFVDAPRPALLCGKRHVKVTAEVEKKRAQPERFRSTLPMPPGAFIRAERLSKDSAGGTAEKSYSGLCEDRPRKI